MDLVTGEGVHSLSTEGFFFFFLPYLTASRILVPRPGIKPVPTAMEGQSLNPWTARGVPS